MEKLYIGKIVSTHGIKGEIKILSDSQFPEKAFKVGTHLIIDNKSYLIKTYRKHKNFNMVTLDDYNDINQILFLLKKQVYKDKEELNLNNSEILDSDLINYKVIANNEKNGIIKEIFMASPTNKIIRVMFDKEILIPLSSPMVKEISKEKQEIVVELIDGMI